MRGFVLLGCAAAICAFASSALAYPDGAEALEARLLVKMGPQAKSWIAREAAHESTAHVLSDGTARNAAFQYGAPEPDVDALAFLVLIQAERDADNAVRGVAVADMSANAAKDDARQSALGSNLTATAQHAQMSGNTQLVNSANADPVVSLMPPDPNATKPPPPSVAARSAPAPQGVDLQDAMDRESQLDDLVVGAMRRITPTQESLVPPMP